tara:strand:- start:361 stop:531 length:171 start_codon:yes stop_codon:yes gene_type:complete
MRNYDIIKKIFEITQQKAKGERWERTYQWEDKIKEIEELIADQRPAITGPKYKIKN